MRIHGEEEASRLELGILDLPVDGLEGAVADREHPISHDIAFLLGENGSEPHRAKLGDGLHAVVAAGDAGGDVTRWRRLEGYVADLQSLDELTPLPLVIDGDVV